MSHRRHPSEERLLAFAAGTLSAPEAVAVATHLALRPESGVWVDLAREVGGALIDRGEPAPLDPSAKARLLDRLGDVAPGADAPLRVAPADPSLPAPLRDFALGPWRWVGPRIHVRDVQAPTDGACRVILLRIGPGQSTPMHTHGGVELTCVLEGAYETADGVFEPGDFEEADPSVTHRPRVVSPGPCLCVAALDGQISLPGRLGRLLTPFVRL